MNTPWAEATSNYDAQLRLIVTEIKPRRIVLEETNEYFQKGQSGHYIDEHSRIVSFTESAADWHCTYKIWREVKEEE